MDAGSEKCNFKSDPTINYALRLHASNLVYESILCSVKQNIKLYIVPLQPNIHPTKKITVPKQGENSIFFNFLD
jgi:hypothetical protein